MAWPFLHTSTLHTPAASAAATGRQTITLQCGGGMRACKLPFPFLFPTFLSLPVLLPSIISVLSVLLCATVPATSASPLPLPFSPVSGDSFSRLPCSALHALPAVCHLKSAGRHFGMHFCMAKRTFGLYKSRHGVKTVVGQEGGKRVAGNAAWVTGRHFALNRQWTDRRTRWTG